MKLSKKEFKKFILSEVTKVALEEGWVAEGDLLSEGCNNDEKCTCECGSDCKCGPDCKCKSKKDEEEPDKKKLEEGFEEVLPEKEEINPEDASVLAEEIKRMKQLLDFRSPLLGGK